LSLSIPVENSPIPPRSPVSLLAGDQVDRFLALAEQGRRPFRGQDEVRVVAQLIVLDSVEQLLQAGNEP
jgi:hypothetical protein